MFLSFIIPIYNTESYLNDCLYSLIHQDLSPSEYEIVCINDGSTDASLNILEKWAQQAENIIIINQNNAGVCIARNVGLDKAQGDYIWFIDSDDFVKENVLGNLKKLAYEENYDRIIVGNYGFIHSELRDKRQLQKNTSWQDSVVWRNIFKREYLLNNDLRFHYPELAYGEDALFMYEIKCFKPYTFEVDEYIYFHRVREFSAGYEDSSIDAKVKKIQSNLIEAQVMKKYYEQGNSIPETADRLMSFLWGTLYRTAELPQNKAAPIIKEMKTCGLFPYKRPGECTIKKSHQLSRNDFVEKIFDMIYTNLNRSWGYFAMRFWFKFFEIKNKRGRDKRIWIDH